MTTREQVAAYMRMVWEPDDLIEVRAITKDSVPNRVEIVFLRAVTYRATLTAWRNGTLRANVYVGVLPRLREGGTKDTDCGPGLVVWADFDGVEPGEALRRAEAARMPKPPAW